MHAWNTISRTSDDKVTLAIQLLETVSKDESIPILEFMRKRGGGTFHDILLSLKINAQDLERQLKQLIAAGALKTKKKTTATYYTLNQGRLSTISQVAGRLNELRLEGVKKS